MLVINIKKYSTHLCTKYLESSCNEFTKSSNKNTKYYSKSSHIYLDTVLKLFIK